MIKINQLSNEMLTFQLSNTAHVRSILWFFTAISIVLPQLLAARGKQFDELLWGLLVAGLVVLILGCEILARKMFQEIERRLKVSAV